MNQLLENLDDLPHSYKIAIYGTGVGCSNIMRLLRLNRSDVVIVCLLDTFKSGEKDGIKIISPNEFTEYSSSVDLILIASDYSKEIVTTLKKMGISNYAVASQQIMTDTTGLESKKPALNIPIFSDYISRYKLYLAEIVWLRNCMREKEKIAEKIGSKKIVFAGGSATHFGVRSRDVQKHFNIPAINFAAHAGLQLDYIIYKTREILKSGDTVIFIPEYETLLYDGRVTTKKFIYLINFDREYFKKLPLIKRLKALTTIDAPGLLLTFLFQKREYQLDNYYRAESLNENGDETVNFGNKIFPVNYTNILQRPYLGSKKIMQTFALSAIVDFNRWCEDNGVKLYLTYPNLVYFRECKSEKYRDYFAKLSQFFQDNRIKTLGNPYNFFYHKKLFFDFKYHLNHKGVTIRTNQLIRLMEKEKVIV